MEIAASPYRKLSSVKKWLPAAIVLLPLILLTGCGGHHHKKSTSSDGGDSVSADIYDVGTSYISSGGGGSSSSSGSSKTDDVVTGSYVDSHGVVHEIVGTVDSNGYLAATDVNTSTGDVSSGSGTVNSDGSFTITNDDSGDTDTGDTDSDDDN